MEQKNSPISLGTAAIVVITATSIGAGAALGAQLAFSGANPNSMKTVQDAHPAADTKPSTESERQYDEVQREEEIVSGRLERIRSLQPRADIQDAKFSDAPAALPSNRVTDSATFRRYLPAQAPTHQSATDVEPDVLPAGASAAMTDKRAARLCDRDGIPEWSGRFTRCKAYYREHGTRYQPWETKRP